MFQATQLWYMKEHVHLLDTVLAVYSNDVMWSTVHLQEACRLDVCEHIFTNREESWVRGGGAALNGPLSPHALCCELFHSLPLKCDRGGGDAAAPTGQRTLKPPTSLPQGECRPTQLPLPQIQAVFTIPRFHRRTHLFALFPFPPPVHMSLELHCGVSCHMSLISALTTCGG